MIVYALFLLATLLAMLSVYFNTRNGKLADRCLYAAYTILLVAVIIRWNAMIVLEG